MKGEPGSLAGHRRESAPSLTVSFVFVALTIGVVALVSAVSAAPGLVAAFLAGVGTAVVVTLSREARTGDRRAASLADAALARR